MFETESGPPAHRGVAVRMESGRRLMSALVLALAVAAAVLALAWSGTALWPFWAQTSIEGLSTR